MRFIQNIHNKNVVSKISGFALIVSLLFIVFPGQEATAKKSLPENYPRVGNYFLDPYISTYEAEQLAKWDVVVLGFDTQYNSPDAFTKMKEINPDIILLAYIPSEEVPLKHLGVTDKKSPVYTIYHRLVENDNWYLKNSSGEYVNFYPDTRMINVTTAWKKSLSNFVTKHVLKEHPKKWDGVFYDNCFNNVAWVDPKIDVDADGKADNWNTADAQWKNGMNVIMKRTRNKNPNSFIVCNSNGDYYTYINGRLMEAFPSDYDGGWSGSMEKYFNVIADGDIPSMVIVNTVADSTDSTNYKLMRYNLGSTLLGNGFASYDQSIDVHHSLWWYDEYSVALGNPLGGAFNVDTNAGPTNFTDGLWRRNFQRGIVFVNSSNSDRTIQLEEGFEKILGTQDTTVNNGEVVGTVKIPAHDGIILLGRIDQVANAPFINGTFAKVFNVEGNQTRNAFFSYNSLFPGSNTIIYLEDVATTIIADETYVTVRKNGQTITKFAPYGDQFKGGINIAVDRLDGKKKGYRIVTGTKDYGPHVKIYSLKGKLRNPGCFPYAESFRGGVNVAIGDVIKKNGGKEIVVAAAKGGGPHVRILNRNCELISPGFFAYDESLHTGISVAAGDIDNDGSDEIVTIPSQGGAPYVRMFNHKGNEVSPGFYAFNKDDRNGAQISVSDIDGDELSEIVAMSFSIFNQ
ncbi:MAG: putative glycoside hydrolase [bacterium]|nr:putative glycoside hydrolase [bacterium]